MRQYKWAPIALMSSLLMSAMSVSAEESTPPAPKPSDERLEPEIVITPGPEGRVKEYRVNGQLYMIEITPTKGAPYYLVDMDGDGLLETRSNQVGQPLVTPRWILLRW